MRALACLGRMGRKLFRATRLAPRATSCVFTVFRRAFYTGFSEQSNATPTSASPTHFRRFKRTRSMDAYGSLCDDFYVNMNLSTEMELPHGRETVLHYFERIQKKYPTMRNFYCRGEKQDFVLEEDKDKGSYRWATIEHRRVCSGYVNPTSVDAALEQHRLALDLAPFMLSVSPLDCEALDVLFGFDFTYRGNHNQLVAEALNLSPS